MMQQSTCQADAVHFPRESVVPICANAIDE
jgi:hypothetical protein